MWHRTEVNDTAPQQYAIATHKAQVLLTYF
jgi:hypothetical protein